MALGAKAWPYALIRSWRRPLEPPRLATTGHRTAALSSPINTNRNTLRNGQRNSQLTSEASSILSGCSSSAMADAVAFTSDTPYSYFCLNRCDGPPHQRRCGIGEGGV